MLLCPPRKLAIGQILILFTPKLTMVKVAFSSYDYRWLLLLLKGDARPSHSAIHTQAGKIALEVARRPAESSRRILTVKVLEN